MTTLGPTTDCASSSTGSGRADCRRQNLKLDAWPRELSPSIALRRWYDHDAARFVEFRRRYRAELAEHKDDLSDLRKLIKGRVTTLLTATRDLDLSHGRVLREVLGKSAPKKR